MSTMLTFDSKEVAAKERYRQFQTFVDQLFSRLEITPLPGRDALRPDTGFRAWVSARSFADLALARISNTALRVCRDKQRAGQSCERQFLLKLQTGGTGIFSQAGRTAHLQPGDFVLCDNMEPYELLCLGESAQVVVSIPEGTLLDRMPGPDAWIGCHMRGDEPINARLAELIVAIANDANRLPAHAETRRMHEFLDTLSFALSMPGGGRHAAEPAKVDHSSGDRSRGEYSRGEQGWLRREGCRNFLEIKNYIDQHVDDPELTPESIASASFISVRYVHMLFKRTGISVSAYIRGQRMARCRRDLASSPDTTITDIALRWGFNDGAHFSRLFKIYYGMSPQRYREIIRASAPLRLTA